jgi:hypothetical protein
MIFYKKSKIRIQFRSGAVDELWVWDISTRFSGNVLTGFKWHLCSGRIMFVDISQIEYIREVDSKLVFRLFDPKM